MAYWSFILKRNCCNGTRDQPHNIFHTMQFMYHPPISFLFSDWISSKTIKIQLLIFYSLYCTIKSQFRWPFVRCLQILNLCYLCLSTSTIFNEQTIDLKTISPLTRNQDLKVISPLNRDETQNPFHNCFTNKQNLHITYC